MSAALRLVTESKWKAKSIGFVAVNKLPNS
jgi:hypothetical protein